MPSELFSVIAVLKATDEMSKVLEKVDASLDKFSETAARTASVAAESGAKVDESLLQTASGADALELAATRTAAAQDKLAAATEAQAAAEQALLAARDAVASEEELAGAADAVASAEQRATAATAELTSARAGLKAASAEKRVDEEAVAAATRAVAEAEAGAAVSASELKTARAALKAAASQGDEEALAAATETAAAAEARAAASATELRNARAALRAASKEQVDEEAVARATESAAAAEQRAAAATQELTDARARQAGLVTSSDVAKAADALAAAERRAAAAAREADAAQAHLAGVERAAAGASEEAAGRTDAAAAAQGRLRGASDGAGAAAGLASKAMKFGALAVAAVGYESVKAATSYQTLTTRLVTTAGESQSNLKLIQQGMLGISQTTGSTADDLAKSMYIVEAAGYRGADGLKVLQAATEGAKLEGSDFGTVSNAVTDILKDYHLGADQAANVTSQLVAAVGSGKANFQQMSASMANILPMAAAVHLKFSDVSAVLATMTSHGVTAQRASQNMANALRSLEAPTGTMVKEFDKVGITAKDVQSHLASQGLGGTLQWLAGIAQKDAPKLGQTYPGALRALMGTAAGLNVALMTTGENSKDVKTAIGNISKAAADAHGNVSGFSQIQQTMAFKLDQAKNAVHNVGIVLGTMLLPVVTRVAGAVAGLLGPMAGWIEHNQKVIKLIAAIVGPALAVVGVIKMISLVTKAWTAAQLLLNTAMDENPIGLLITVLAAVVGGLIYAYTHFKTFRDVVNDVGKAVVGAWGAVAGFFSGLWKSITRIFDSSVSAVIGIVKHWYPLILGVLSGGILLIPALIFKYWRQISGFVSGIWNDVLSVTTAIWSAISGFFKKWWPLLLVIFAAPIAVLVSLWNHTHQALFDAARAVWSAVSSFFSSIWSGIESTAKTVWRGIQLGIVQPIEVAWRWLVQAFTAVYGFLAGIFRTMTGLTLAAWNLIYRYIVDPLEQAFGFVSRIFSQIVSTIRSAINGVLNWLSGIGSWFVNIGSDIVNGIISGIESAGSSLFSTLGNLAKSALNAAKSFLGIGSPSKEFSEQVGKWIPHGIAAGVTAYAGVAQQAVAGLAKSLPATVSTQVHGDFAAVGAGIPALAGAGGVGAGGGVSEVHLHFDMQNAVVANQSAMDQLAHAIGKRIATAIGPSAGLKFNTGML